MSKERLTAEEWLKEKGFTADSMFAQRLLHDMAANMAEFATEEVEAAIAETKKQRDELLEALRDIINIDKHSHLTSTNASLMRERAEIAITNAQEK
jgi:hypothetical protein